MDDMPAQPRPCSDALRPAGPRARVPTVVVMVASFSAERKYAVRGLAQDRGLLGGREPGEVFLQVGPDVPVALAAARGRIGADPHVPGTERLDAHVDDGG